MNSRNKTNEINVNNRLALASTILLLALGPAACSNEADIVKDSEEQERIADSDPFTIGGPSHETAPVYVVTGHGINAKQAAALALSLGIDADAAEKLLDEHGAISYIDVERFQKLPELDVRGTTPKAPDEQGQPVGSTDVAVDIEALKALEAPSEASARAQVETALADAGIDVGPSVTTLGHSVFEAFDKDGTQTLEVNLDTQVTYETQLEGLRLIGPGAKVKVVLDPEGHASQVVVAMHELERGEDIAIISSAQAQAECAAQLGGDIQHVSTDLVYYAPPVSQRASKIFPHYVCESTKLIDGKETDARKFMIPAIEDAPQASMKLNTVGGEIRAFAEVEGGTAPYTYSWASSSKSLANGTDGTQIEYAVTSRTAGNTDETLTLYVTDANGLTARVAETVVVNGTTSVKPPGSQQMPDPASTNSVQSAETSQVLWPSGTIGTEWVGSCGGLGGSAANAGGFVNRFSWSGINAQFNFGEWNAWELDFKDPIYGGDDTWYADAVDLVFYTGHAGADGFYFCSNMNDNWLDLGTEAQLGYNLEWLVIAACGPLQGTQWPMAFAGLHLLLGYTTVSYDNTTEGYDFANYLLNAYNMRSSWAGAATNSQPADVIYGYGGVWFWNGFYWIAANIDDYFHGMGPVGEDRLNYYGVWKVTSPS